MHIPQVEEAFAVKVGHCHGDKNANDVDDYGKVEYLFAFGYNECQDEETTYVA